jgi:hypothetical protein
MAVVGYGQQAVALHASHRLTDGGSALAQALSDSRSQRGHTFLFELEDGA